MWLSKLNIFILIHTLNNFHISTGLLVQGCYAKVSLPALYKAQIVEEETIQVKT